MSQRTGVYKTDNFPSTECNQMQAEIKHLSLSNLQANPESARIPVFSSTCVVVVYDVAQAVDVSVVSPSMPIAVSVSSLMLSHDTPTTSRFLGAYTLPAFPPSIMTALISGDTSLLTDRNWCCKVIVVLYEDLLSKVALYPAAEHYATACETLVDTYPFLEDKLRTGRQNWQRAEM